MSIQKITTVRLFSRDPHQSKSCILLAILLSVWNMFHHPIFIYSRSQGQRQITDFYCTFYKTVILWISTSRNEYFVIWLHVDLQFKTCGSCQSANWVSVIYQKLLLCQDCRCHTKWHDWRLGTTCQWFSARLHYLQCISNGDTAVLH